MITKNNIKRLTDAKKGIKELNNDIEIKQICKLKQMY